MCIFQLKLCQIEMKNKLKYYFFKKKKNKKKIKQNFTIFSSVAITKRAFTYFIKINKFLYGFYYIN